MDRRTRIFLIAGLAVTVVVAAVVSGFASSEPDGLERVSIDEGFDETAEDHALDDSPLADYSVEGVDDDRLSTGIAGVIGVALTLAASVGLLYGVSRFRKRRSGAG
jgi:cobalt/nickel transport system permease protein